MCRMLAYLGRPIIVEELLYRPDNSFIKQSYHPKLMAHLLNLAGFGMVAWDTISYKPDQPYIYKTPHLPFYDENLRYLANKITPHCLLAHLRGVSYNEKQIVSNQNVHPFIFEKSPLALAHNGALMNFDKMKYHLVEYIDPYFLKEIKGTTDSEWIYALLLTQLSNSVNEIQPEKLAQGIVETLKILQHVRAKCKIAITSPVNLVVTNGKIIAATRFVFDYGWQLLDAPATTHSSYHSLWYTYGEAYGLHDNEYKMKTSKIKSSIIIASEPLTKDVTTWISVPEYTLIMAYLENEEIKIISQDINI